MQEKNLVDFDDNILDRAWNLINPIKFLNDCLKKNLLSLEDSDFLKWNEKDIYTVIQDELLVKNNLNIEHIKYSVQKFVGKLPKIIQSELVCNKLYPEPSSGYIISTFEQNYESK